MVPVFFGFMGFAIDLGRLYLIRGELNEAANAMALAAASQLIGASAAATNAFNVMPPPVGVGPTYNYNFGAFTIGQSYGILTSTVNPPVCYGSVSDALSGVGNTVDCGSAQYAQVSLTADAPLLFWSLLPVAAARKTAIAARAVAGVSAPLCTACNIVPIGVVAINPSDTLNFGFDATFSTIYTLSYSCTGTPLGILSGTIPYYLLNRLDSQFRPYGKRPALPGRGGRHSGIHQSYSQRQQRQPVDPAGVRQHRRHRTGLGQRPAAIMRHRGPRQDHGRICPLRPVRAARQQPDSQRLHDRGGRFRRSFFRLPARFRRLCPTKFRPIPLTPAMAAV